MADEPAPGYPHYQATAYGTPVAQHHSPWLAQQQGQHAPAPHPSYQAYGAPASGHPVTYTRPPEYLQRREWMTDLCGCMMDPCNCLFTLICPCIAFGRVAERLDDGETSCTTAALVWYVLQQFTTCGCLYSTAYRQKLRRKYNLPSRPLPDFLVHYFCWYCAICQEHRELKYREAAGYNSYAGGRLIPPPHQSFVE